MKKIKQEIALSTGTWRDTDGTEYTIGVDTVHGDRSKAAITVFRSKGDMLERLSEGEIVEKFCKFD